VVVASGHYHAPVIPDTPGLKEIKEKWPSRVWHSKNYRHPEIFKDKVSCAKNLSGMAWLMCSRKYFLLEPEYLPQILPKRPVTLPNRSIKPTDPETLIYPPPSYPRKPSELIKSLSIRSSSSTQH